MSKMKKKVVALLTERMIELAIKKKKIIIPFVF